MGILQLIAERLAPEEFNAPNSTLRQVTKGAEDAAFALVSTSAISGAVMAAAQAAVNLGGNAVTGVAEASQANVTGANATPPGPAGIPQPQQQQGQAQAPRSR